MKTDSAFTLKRNLSHKFNAVVLITAEGSIMRSIRRSIAVCTHSSVITVTWNSVSKFLTKASMYDVVKTTVMLNILKQNETLNKK
jgi:hypothetical protein